MNHFTLILFLCCSATFAWSADSEKGLAVLPAENFAAAPAEFKPSAEPVRLVGELVNDSPSVMSANGPRVSDTAKEALAFIGIDSNENADAKTILLWAMGIIAAYFLARWLGLFGQPKEAKTKAKEIKAKEGNGKGDKIIKDKGGVKSFLWVIFWVLLISFCLSSFFSIFSFVFFDDPAYTKKILIETAVIALMLFVLLAVGARGDRNVSEDHVEQHGTKGVVKGVMWVLLAALVLSSVASVALYLFYQQATDAMTFFYATVGFAALGFLLWGIIVLAKMADESRLKNMSESSKQQLAFMDKMVDEASEDPNFDYDRWLARNRHLMKKK